MKMLSGGSKGSAPIAPKDVPLCGSRLLTALPLEERARIARHLVRRDLRRTEVLFEPGDDIEKTYFPCRGTMGSLVVILSDGREVEAATIGHEGAIGGIVSAGHKPAYTRAVVQIGGPALAIETARLEEVKAASPPVRELFSRYADALLAQIMQSVACNALHSVEARCSRWLLSTQDRIVSSGPIPLTQEALAEMIGVQRTTVTVVMNALEARGLIRHSRGRVEILDRAGIQKIACECYNSVEDHFARVLPAAVLEPN